MPVLARYLEDAGFSTVLVTNMPFWLEKSPVPRTLAVEFPFAHLFGLPGDHTIQRHILRQALAVLVEARTPGTVVHSPEIWPESTTQAMQMWQPTQASPVVQLMAPHLRELLAARRRRV